MSQVKKIALTGPECSGKTSLCRVLATYHRTACVPEFSRYYLKDLDGPYNCQDLLYIAKGQVRLEKTLEPLANKFLFCDTGLDVISVWSRNRFRTCDPWIQEQSSRQDHVGYILTTPDIEWEPDPLREHPHQADRYYFFEQYRKILEDRGKPFCIVEGDAASRLREANRFIDRWL